MHENDDEQPKPVRRHPPQPATAAGGSGVSDEFGGPLNDELTDSDQFIERSRGGLTAQGPGGMSFNTWFEGTPRTALLWAAPAGGIVDGIVWVAGGTGPGIGVLVFMLLVISLATYSRRRS